MTVLLQISDTHFGTEQPAVVQALLALAAQQRPDLVVLSGDITQRARPSQFRAARSFADQLGAPVLAIPGNHDIALFNLMARALYPYAAYTNAFGHDLEPVFTSAQLMVVGVKTTRRYRHKHGEVSADQVQRVAQLLQTATPDQLRVVVVHQPIAVAHPSDVNNRLRGHADAQRTWAAAGADIVMSGHIHLSYVLPLTDLPRPMWVVQAGTAVSRRLRQGLPNSVNLLRWSGAGSGGRCLVEQWDYVAALETFGLVNVTDIAPARAVQTT